MSRYTAQELISHIASEFDFEDYENNYAYYATDGLVFDGELFDEEIGLDSDYHPVIKMDKGFNHTKIYYGLHGEEISCDACLVHHDSDFDWKELKPEPKKIEGFKCNEFKLLIDLIQRKLFDVNKILALRTSDCITEPLTIRIVGELVITVIAGNYNYELNGFHLVDGFTLQCDEKMSAKLDNYYMFQNISNLQTRINNTLTIIKELC